MKVWVGYVISESTLGKTDVPARFAARKEIEIISGMYAYVFNAVTRETMNIIGMAVFATDVGKKEMKVIIGKTAFVTDVRHLCMTGKQLKSQAVKQRGNALAAGLIMTQCKHIGALQQLTLRSDAGNVKRQKQELIPLHGKKNIN